MLALKRPLAWLALALSLLVASGARGQDLEQKYKKGELLGSGAFKDVYAVVDHPELALGIVVRKPTIQALGDEKIETMLEDEKAMLDKLEGFGLPTAKVLEIGTFEGNKAYVKRRFVTADRAPNWDVDHANVLNKTTLADVQKIRDGLKAADLQVWDAQFLIGADGHVYFADPLAVFKTDDFPENMPDNWRTGIPEATAWALKRIEDAAHAAIDGRTVKALARMPGAMDSAVARFFSQADVKLDPSDAGGANALREGLLHYLETDATTDAARTVAGAVRAGDLTVSFFGDAAMAGSNGVRLALGESFPRIAADLVAKGTASLSKAASTVESDVEGAAQALRFLGAKQTPEELGGGDGPVDPDALVASVAARNGTAVDGASRAALVAQANAILGTRSPSKTAGLSGLLQERVDAETSPDKADAR